MKGITPVVSIVLILMITISLVGVSMIFFSDVTETAGEGGKQTLETKISQAGENFRIENIDKNIVYIRNLGSTELSNLEFFVDNSRMNYTGSSVVANKVGAFVLDDAELSMLPGNHLKVASTTQIEEQETNFYDKYEVGYWEFDEGSGIEVAGSPTGTFHGELFNDGTIDGAVWVDGKYGKALRFDGINDYVDCGNSLDIANEITIEVWIYPENQSLKEEEGELAWCKTAPYTWVAGDINQRTACCDARCIELGYDGGNCGEVVTGTSGGGGNSCVGCTWWDTGETGAETSQCTCYSYSSTNYIISKGNAFDLKIDNNLILTGNINEQPVTTQITNAWNHLTLIYDGSEQKLYVNGELKDSATLSDPINVNTDDLVISDYFNGTIDEVRIYSLALKPEEINQSMNSRYPVNRSVTSFNFNKGSGSTASDSHIWVKGIKGAAISFDGVDDYVDIGDDPSLDLTEAITVEAWIKPSVVEPGNYYTIAARDDGTNRNWWLFINDDGILVFRPVFDGSGKSASTTRTLTPNNWYHVIGTYDKQTVKVYLDGIIGTDTQSETSDIDNDDVSLSIGAREDGIDRLFKGTIDSFRILNIARSMTNE